MNTNDTPPPPDASDVASVQLPQLTHSRTFGAGEHEDGLRNRARELGLTDEAQQPKPVRRAFHQAATIMHSVGVLGTNERLDPKTGNLVYLLQRETSTKSFGRATRKRKTKFGTLREAFEPYETTKEEQTDIEQNQSEDDLVVVQGGSLQAAIFGIIKGTVGPAILYLARGFRAAGWGVAIASMTLATFMFVSNAYLLLECWKVESMKQREMAEHIDKAVQSMSPKDSSSLYSSSATSPTPSYTPVLLTYGELARRGLGRWSAFVSLGIALFQFGVCLTYLIFVPTNIQESLDTLTGGTTISKELMVALIVLIEIPIAWIQDIRKLTPANVTATLLIAFGLCSVLWLAVTTGCQIDPETGERNAVENLRSFPVMTDTWFIFVGTSFFMMEGSMTLIVPLQEAVYLKEDRERFPHVNAQVTSWIVVFYIVFSLICGLAFGDNVQTALTASLEGPLATAVQLAYSLAVLLTFPLQNFPALQVTCTAVLGQRSQSRLHRNILVTGILVLLGIVAVLAIDYLGNVVSLLGSLFGIPLALIFPPLMHTQLVVKNRAYYEGNETKRKRQQWRNYGVVCFGGLATAAASYATLQHWGANGEE